ncbi:MAG: uracil phosphoribosyltransferase [Bacteroidetes bacterium OLB12]|nr:MAG: uracil phosphoribosyltransferase [Bacteroidetes bacterium OLB12]
MQIINLGEQHSIANQFVAELRDVHIQTDRLRFRTNLKRLGEIMAYEISRTLAYQQQTIQTPLALARANRLQKQPVLITVLRAGLPYYQGFQNYFDAAPAGFIGAYRKEGAEIKINLEYLATPDLTNQTLILIDPMLATGNSIIRSVNELERHGKPAHIHVAVLIAAPEGIRFVQDNLNYPATIWTFAIDEKLDPRSYIVPGLGDAGDLSFGEKL